MGTRADFYLGRGENAEWLGSIAWDGHPDSIDTEVLSATDEGGYRAELAKFFEPRDDVTLPERGWPWPWDTSATTDYAYALDEGRMWASRFGGTWFAIDLAADCLGEPDRPREGGPAAIFPDMSARKNVRMDRGSGRIMFGFPAARDA
jgi:hypothetical protein